VRDEFRHRTITDFGFGELERGRVVLAAAGAAVVVSVSFAQIAIRLMSWFVFLFGARR
jgi:hypothetical protein